jgi:hypothetical protein
LTQTTMFIGDAYLPALGSSTYSLPKTAEKAPRGALPASSHHITVW